jgi:hypothetical protein
MPESFIAEPPGRQMPMWSDPHDVRAPAAMTNVTIH